MWQHYRQVFVALRCVLIRILVLSFDVVLEDVICIIQVLIRELVFVVLLGIRCDRLLRSCGRFAIRRWRGRL
jgi:hypothetical protein